MRIGIPSEVKNNEFRVALTDSGVHDLVSLGHSVSVQSGAGSGSGISDAQYRSAGAQVIDDPATVWSSSELILKVKEPQPSEFGYFRPDLVLFTFLHLAAEPALTEALLDSGITSIAYETVQLDNRSLPLLAPMSEVAGRLAVIAGANAMTAPAGGGGLLMPGTPGTQSASVVVLGGGVAGTNATQVAAGMGARVTVLDTNAARLRELDALYQGRIQTIASNTLAIEQALLEADLVIGSVLIPGARAPKLVSNDLVRRMKPGSVLVDIAIDQGGCFADSRPTTHADPTFRVHGSLFYCVANMPGAVPRTSTYALSNATLPYARALANAGWLEALRADSALRRGLSTHAGSLFNASVATAQGRQSVDTDTLF